MSCAVTPGLATPFLRGRSPTKKRIPLRVLYEDSISACPLTLDLAPTARRLVLSDVTEVFVGAGSKFSPNEVDAGEPRSPAQEFGLQYPDPPRDTKNTIVEENLHDQVGFRTEATQNLLRTIGHLKYWTNAVSEELMEEERRTSIIAFDSPRTPWDPRGGSISANIFTYPLRHGSAKTDNTRCFGWGIRPSDGADELMKAQASIPRFSLDSQPSAIPEQATSTWKSSFQSTTRAAKDEVETQYPRYSSPLVHRKRNRDPTRKHSRTNARDSSSQ
ncbi:hypothetical protein M407DRAFT_31812 [Tulasnella calospora MUT 4182]|uniref:Uncharacterized protein n=1 Tax=Tulasnella calospora MUT 4182 TaxID=1051891 RepID=A0A0C3Q525_9AGAM|nr:hypothetical protein M407DRAFT_31812 [Tulasnella calospora MUT 4182]